MNSIDPTGAFATDAEILEGIRCVYAGHQRRPTYDLVRELLGKAFGVARYRRQYEHWITIDKPGIAPVKKRSPFRGVPKEPAHTISDEEYAAVIASIQAEHRAREREPVPAAKPAAHASSGFVREYSKAWRGVRRSRPTL